MAEEETPPPNNPNPNENKEGKNAEPSSKLDALKNHPQVQKTQHVLNKYFMEVFYIVMIIIAIIIGLIISPRWSLALTGVGFLIGVFIYNNVQHMVHKPGAFLKKQEIITQTIIGIVAIILSFFIPYIMLGVFLGLPSGIAIRDYLKSQHSPKS